MTVPDTHRQALLQQALARLGEGAPAEAETLCRQLLQQWPGDVGALHLAGLARLQQRDAAGAVHLLAQATTLVPDDAQLWNNLGCALQQSGGSALVTTGCNALAAFRRATELAPGDADAWANLGLEHSRRGDETAAAEAWQRALALNPRQALAGNGLGILAHRRGGYAEAEGYFRDVLCHHPAYLPALVNLGVVCYENRRLDEAGQLWQQALHLDPHHAEARFRRAQWLLLGGHWREGFAEYEWRWRTDEARHWWPSLPMPLWTGEPLAARTLLLWAEQGLGDTLQFMRFAAPARAAGARVLLRLPRPLLRLARCCPDLDGVHDEAGPVPEADFHLPLMSAPLRLGATPEQLPPPARFELPGHLLRHWAGRLADLPRPRVGLVWSGNPRPGQRDASLVDARRSLDPAQLAPLAGLPVSWVSVQKDPRQKPPLPLHDFTGGLDDFFDTAGLLAQLDLLLAVDTSVPHLAGNLGLPVWLLSRHDGCWRWLLEREDSPWYPGMRLLRQPAPGDWPGLVRSLRGDLENWCRCRQDAGAPAS